MLDAHPCIFFEGKGVKELNFLGKIGPITSGDAHRVPFRNAPGKVFDPLVLQQKLL